VNLSRELLRIRGKNFTNWRFNYEIYQFKVA
jgi:hypothetical protein